MKFNALKTSLGLLAAFACVTPVGTLYAANGNIPTGTTNSIKTNGTSGTSGGSSGTSGDTSGSSSSYSVPGMPSSDIIGGEGAVIQDGITTEEIGNRLTKKGYELADMIRQVCVPICIISFVAGAIMAIFGVFSKKSTIIPGVIAMGVAVLGYVLIYNAPLIIAWCSKFLTSN